MGAEETTVIKRRLGFRVCCDVGVLQACFLLLDFSFLLDLFLLDLFLLDVSLVAADVPVYAFFVAQR